MQQVSMYGPWLLVQRRRLAVTLEAAQDAGVSRLATAWGGGASLSRDLGALEAERREGLLCEVN